MIADCASFTALAAFQTSQLLGFPVKLLDFPTQAAHFLYDLHIVLRHVIRHDIIRALGGEHNPEEFHLVATWKTFDL